MKEEQKKRIVCWDLDETLGYFRRLTSDDDLRYFLTKPGVGLFLQELTNKGYCHVITTAADISYAERALKEAGWLNLFEAIFDRNRVRQTSDGKCYSPVIEFLGVPPEEAEERVLVIGDRLEDKPADLPNVVFIEHPEGYRYDCAPIRTIVDLLDEEGLGFHCGFQKLRAKFPITWESEDAAISFRMAYHPLTSRNERLRSPVVFDIQAESHFEGFR